MHVGVLTVTFREHPLRLGVLLWKRNALAVNVYTG